MFENIKQHYQIILTSKIRASDVFGSKLRAWDAALRLFYRIFAHVNPGKMLFRNAKITKRLKRGSCCAADIKNTHDAVDERLERFYKITSHHFPITIIRQIP